ncbi:SRPBCC family protein [Poseidonibacter lekithochrous]|uniref:SRPBCC family protein n=1 Tax=Poseidonibacter TaxID=2321187 RepID=UPI001C0A36BD|nr:MULTISPECIES: SRPBCC family protein [Poseidonibacter]MBU3013843.1 SRPBCC family protein [Poseidonibacter lekithochrous]MDO6827139.1 SRPBCC family protein [Poseidonibacter sp. 1_MG-2023]
MKKFEKISTINCKIEELFQFHTDMRNLVNITPPDTKVTLINKDFVPHEGGVLKIKTVKNFIPTTWEVKIDKMQEPNLLVDIALKSPFKYWKHSHIFTQKGNICELKDIVEYELPFGMIGNLFDFFIQNELKKMFDYRHKVTKEILNFKARR